MGFLLRRDCNGYIKRFSIAYGYHMQFYLLDCKSIGLVQPIYGFFGPRVGGADDIISDGYFAGICGRTQASEVREKEKICIKYTNLEDFL